MGLKGKGELTVKSFVQTVSSATSFSKRYKKVIRLLDSRPDLTEEQWRRVWRGMYYSIWYTEMGKGCELLAQRIGTHDDLTMILTGFKALTDDWFGIDAFRVDKYMFFVRILIKNCLKLQTNSLLNLTSTPVSTQTNESINGQNNESEDKRDNEEVIVEEEVQKIDDKVNEPKSVDRKRNKLNKKSEKRVLEIVFPIEMKAKLIDNILSIVKPSIGLTLHICDIIIDEFMKVFDEFDSKLRTEQKIQLYFDILLPFVKLMAVSDDYRIWNSVKQNVFDRFKNEILVRESIDTRKAVLNEFIDAMVTIGGVESIGRKNRDSIYNIIGIFKTKLNQLNTTDDKKKSLKRKRIVLRNGRNKKVKYEVTSSSPFVRSIVPIAVV